MTKKFFDYFDLKEAVNEISNEFETKGKAKKSVSLVGKTLFNVGLAAGKASIAIAKEAPRTLAKTAESNLKRSDLTEPEREKWTEIKSKAESINERNKGK
ncbi:hypothetical protein [Pseudoalteromonas piscicida]|uniref:Uncharacterized protein n=1 Tax=Pseudoalteromonas piscicida TaxID=43662 RepID=A0AAD0RJS9_PSEO7|nr:hypothetical protein [Pseudoalteromonas piscicida]ASD66314.1 hypothetical protein B1L02_04205 [Pseudoalteromonas piscicida]AXR02980.1 hypothetical protein D0511_13555 [Pseudoalteromonas piscicida]